MGTFHDFTRNKDARLLALNGISLFRGLCAMAYMAQFSTMGIGFSAACALRIGTSLAGSDGTGLRLLTRSDLQDELAPLRWLK